MEDNVSNATVNRCLLCQEAFSPTRRWQRFCSDKHRKEWHSARYRGMKGAAERAERMEVALQAIKEILEEVL